MSGDTARDGLALVQCAHTRDWEGARAILRNCDTQMVASFLAMVVADLLREDPDRNTGAQTLLLLRQRYGANKPEE